MRLSNCCSVVLLALLVACSRATAPGAVGVDRPQLLLVSQQELERVAEQSYRELLSQARKQGALDRDPAQVERIRAVADRLIPQTVVFRKDAPDWAWEAHVIASPEVNAWCMPGGKIAVYTGLLERLRPDDEELAAVLGHEIAHALREHGRERLSLAIAERLALTVVGTIADVPKTALDLAPLFLELTLNLPYSRRQETEADRIGVELAARAAYDPRAAIALWEKMRQVDGGRPPKFLATHPSPEDRIRDLRVHAEKVMPLYAASARAMAPRP